MIRGPEIIEAIVNEVRRRLQADCFLAPHMLHHNFSLYGCLELTLTSDDRPPFVTECFIRMGSANNGRGTGAACPDRQAVAERAGSGTFGTRQLKSHQQNTTRKGKQSSRFRQRGLRCRKRGSPYRYRLLPMRQVCANSNALFANSRDSRTMRFFAVPGWGARTLRLLNAHAGTLWKAAAEGQTRKYYPLSSDSSA
jgi:hypothetical protein